MLNLNYEPDVLVEDITTLSHDEWKLYRTLGIGGSDAAAVCGISPWKTARDLYEEKVHKKIREQNDDGWVAKEIGKRLEELVVQIFMKRTDTRPYAVRKMFRHPLYPLSLMRRSICWSAKPRSVTTTLMAGKVEIFRRTMFSRGFII